MSAVETEPRGADMSDCLCTCAATLNNNNHRNNHHNNTKHNNDTNKRITLRNDGSTFWKRCTEKVCGALRTKHPVRLISFLAQTPKFEFLCLRLGRTKDKRAWEDIADVYLNIEVSIRNLFTGSLVLSFTGCLSQRASGHPRCLRKLSRLWCLS